MLAGINTLASLPAVADSNNPDQLPTVTSEALRPIGGVGYSAGRSITEFDEANLNIAHERTVDEVLRGHPGIVVSKGGGFSAGPLYLRGATAQGTLTLDGLPIPDTVPGVVNLNALIPDGLESLTVSRGFGPAYQPFSALGGAIQLTSRNADDNSGDLRVEGGTFGFLKETLRSTLKGEQCRIAVTASHSKTFDGAYHAQKSWGNSERDPFHGTNVLAKAGFAFDDALDWEGSLFYRDSFNALDQFGWRYGVPAIVDGDSSFVREEAWMAQNSLKARLGNDWFTRLQLGYTHKRFNNQLVGIDLSYETDFYLARWENDQRLWQGQDGNALHLVWGVDARHENAAGPTFNNLTFAPAGPFAEGRSQQAGFIETRFADGRLSGDVGVRYEGYDRYQDQALFHVGAAYQLTPAWKLRGNGGNGFRIPGYTDRLFPLMGNIHLKPERGVGGDLGLEWQPTTRLKLDLTGFYSRYDDLMIVTWNPQPSVQMPCVECISNLADATVAGLEAGGDLTFNEQWRGGASYTYTDSRNLATDRPVTMRPRDTARLWGEWRMPTLPITLWAEGVYRGQTHSDIGNTLVVGDTLRFNAQLNYRISPKLGLYVRGENLNNDRTSEFYSLDYPGAAVYGGVELKL